MLQSREISTYVEGGGTAQFCKAAECRQNVVLDIISGYVTRRKSCAWIRVTFACVNGYWPWMKLHYERTMMPDIDIAQDRHAGNLP